MHTSRTMRPDEFDVTVDGRPGSLDAVLPSLTPTDRIAIVTHTPGGSLAAAPLLLAAVGRYYEMLRSERNDFYRYPSYFVVHVGQLRAYHGWLDVWSHHKEVVVAAHGQAVLEALHDRAVSRVLLEDVPPADGELMRETANWFLEEVADVLTFTPGHTEGAFSVRPSPEAARLIHMAAEASHGLLPDDAQARVKASAHLPQAFERITGNEGLRRLCGYGKTPEVLGQDGDYLARHGAGAEVMAPHRLAVR